jgi:hypothetical protein
MSEPMHDMVETVSDSASASASEPTMSEVLARQQSELDRLREAFELLGVNACQWCHKYHRRAEPGALFDAGGGKLVCYPCISKWWPECCSQLTAKEREDLEGKLVFWLKATHNAEVFKDPAKLPDSSMQELHLVAQCLECRGTGKSLGEDTCRFCMGRGTVWVIVSRKHA